MIRVSLLASLVWVTILGHVAGVGAQETEAPPPTGLVTYKSPGPGLQSDIFLVHDDGTAGRRLAANPAEELYPTLSPDGSAVAFVSDRDGSWGLYRVGVDDAGLELLHAGLASADGSPPEDLAWSPDGRHLIIVLRPGRVARAYRLSLDDRGLRPITDGEMDTGAVEFGLRGRRIYMRRNLPFKAYTADIWSSRPDGSDMRRLTHASTGSSSTGTSDRPAALRVGGVEKIAFARMVALERSQIFLMNPDGSDPRNLSRNEFRETMPVSSPCVDGELLIQSDRGGHREVWRIRIDGGEALRLTSSGGGNPVPRSWWVPPGAGGCR